MRLRDFFYFHENDRVNHWKPSLDFVDYDLFEGFMAMSDGIVREHAEENLQFPGEFYSGYIAERFVRKAKEIYREFDFDKGEMDEMLHALNMEIYKINESFGLDPDDREKYWGGECTGAVMAIQGDTLHYGMLEDVYVNVLRGKNYKNILEIDYQIMKAYAHARKVSESGGSRSFEEVWCRDLRNNPDAKNEDGELVGWGAFNGQEEASQFWQTGSIKLEAGDIVLIASNGMLPVLEKAGTYKPELDSFIFHDASSMGVADAKKMSESITEMSIAGFEKLTREKSFMRAIWK